MPGDAVENVLPHFRHLLCLFLPEKRMQKSAEVFMYDVMSPHAVDFIDDGEIQATLKFAEENKNNAALVDEIIAKAREFKGLNHREALVLLDCELADKKQEILDLAMEIKRKFYGNRIVMFAPLYLSNYCINSCVYCP